MDLELIKARMSCIDYAIRQGLPIKRSGDRCRSPLRPEAANPSSFVIYTDYWYDFGDSKGGDVIDMCALMEHNGDRGMAIRQLAAATGVDDTHEYDKWLKQSRSNNDMVKQWHDALRPQDMDYLRKRGLTDATIAALDLGYNAKERRITIPFFKNGRVTAWTGRATELNQEPKYKKSPNTSVTDRSAPWGLHTLHLKSDHLTVTEGAFDAMSFFQEGFPVLATMGSAFNAEQLQTLRSLAHNYEYVLLAFDSDQAGQSFTVKLGKFLFKHHIRYRTATIPNGYKDVSEYFADGGKLAALPTADGVLSLIGSFDSLEAFTAFIRDASRFMQKPDVAMAFKYYRQLHPEADSDYLKECERSCKQAPAEDYIARRVTEAHDLKFQSGVGFYEYTGTHWQLIPDEQVQGYISAELGRYRKGTTTKSILSLLRSDCLFMDEFDRKPLFNFLNGTLHLDGDQLSFRPHSPADLCAFRVDYAYDASAVSPEWDAFVLSIAGGDDARAALLQQIAGYTLFPQNVFQVCSFLIGDGSNGKSVYLKLLTKVFGQPNVSTVEMSALASDFQKIALRQSLLNIGSETSSDVKGVESCFKSITAGDMISGCYKGKDFISFVPRCKLIFACNSMPRVTDASYGFYRRMNFVNFPNRYVKHPDPHSPNEMQADLTLADRLSDQLPAIFNWCVEGYLSLIRSGEFVETSDTEQMLSDFQELTDPVSTFFKETEIEFPVTRQELYEEYVDWCRTAGLSRIRSKASFSREARRFLPSDVIDSAWKVDKKTVRGYKKSVTVDYLEEFNKLKKVN